MDLFLNLRKEYYVVLVVLFHPKTDFIFSSNDLFQSAPANKR